MPTFLIQKNGIKEIQKNNLLRVIPLMVLALIGGLLIGMRNTGDTDAEVSIWPYMIPLFVVVIWIGLYRGLKKQKQLLETYKITITDNVISREQVNTPTISLYFNEINVISKEAHGGFTIKGPRPGELIVIPKQIENIDLLEKELQNIRPVSMTSQIPFFQRYGLLLGVVNLTLMVLIYKSSNKWIVGMAGLFFGCIMTWSYLSILRSKNIDDQTKKGLRLTLLVTVAVLIYVILKLGGWVDVQS
jgi:hypothetical protein